MKHDVGTLLSFVQRRPGRDPARAELASDRWLAALVAGVVHEMNTPVGALASSAQTIDALSRRIEGDATDEDLTARLKLLRELAALQQQAAARLTETVQALERFDDLDRSDRREVDLAVSIEATLTVLGVSQDRRIRLNIAPNTPRPLTSARLLNRLLAHALSRALDAAGPSEVVTVSTHRLGGDRVGIDIHDTGPAVDPAVLDGLTAPRWSTTNARVGLDLGWATAERILEVLGGSMTVHSDHGAGTTVTLVLPQKTDPIE